MKVEELLCNAGIIRHHGKILAAIKNAQIFIDIQEKHGSRDNFIRSYTDGKIIDNQIIDYKTAPANTDLATTISKNLKKLGMKFI